MSQSSVIAGVLLAAFIVWLAVNDRLRAYTAILWGPTTQPKPSGDIKTSGAAGGSPMMPGIGIPGMGGGSGGGFLPDLTNVIEGTFAEAAPLMIP